MNKNVITKILNTKKKSKINNIKNGIFSLNKNKLNISIQEIKKKKNNEKNDNFNKDNNIKSMINIKKWTIDNNSTPDLNKKIIFNPLLRQKLFHE